MCTEDTSDILNTALTGIVDPIVYGVFNTPVNAISGSAVCMFNISDVIETFMGSFKDQEAMDSNWLPVKKVWLEYNRCKYNHNNKSQLIRSLALHILYYYFNYW